MEIKGLSEKWYWKAINILKASSRSLPNFSHLWDPQSRSFILHINEIRNPPALDCLAKCWTCCRFLSSQGRVNDPTPVLSDTCFSPLSQSGERGNLRSHEINLGWGGSNHYTWLISVCACVTSLPCRTDKTHWHADRSTQGVKEGEIKGNYSVWPGLETWPKRLSKFTSPFPPILS